MKRRSFLASAVTALPFALGRGPMIEASATQQEFVTTSAPQRSRYRVTLERVLDGTGPAYTTEFLMEDILATKRRRFTNFSGDVSGRWIGAVATACLTFGEDVPRLQQTVAQVVAKQHPEGYFGKVFRYQDQDDDDMALLWGNGRLLVGLVEYYKYRQDPAVLTASRRLGDFLLTIAPDFNTQKKADEFGAAHYGSSYICWTQQTEGLAALYALTKDTRYLELCTAITQRIERRPSDHVHGYLCSVRGAVDLYAQTGNTALLTKAIAEWKSVMSSGDVLVTGGVPERWSPLAKRTEGCAECDWLRLNLALYKVTGEAQYLEAAERVLFNECSMNQFASGDFGHGVLTEAGTPDEVVVPAWWCCTLHGLRAFADVHDNVFRSVEDTVTYVLPVDGAIHSREFAAVASSTLKTDGCSQIRVKKGGGRTLDIRQPEWATSVVVTRNGKAIPGLRVEQVADGDVIHVRYAMRVREVPTGSSPSLKGRRSFFYGPWLLGVAKDRDPAFFGEHQPANQVVRSTLTASAGASRGAFDVPIAAQRIDYVPAEFPDQPGTVELRAVAEQTSKPSTRWETSFLVVNERGAVISS